MHIEIRYEPFNLIISFDFAFTNTKAKNELSRYRE